MSAQNYGFKIGAQPYNLVNLIKGTESFGFFNHLRFTWISFMSCFASQDDLDELKIFRTANKVLEAAANNITNKENASDQAIKQMLSNPSLQELSKALKKWSKSLPNNANNGQTAATERTALRVLHQVQAPRPAPQTNERNALFCGEVRPKACFRAGNGNSCFVNTALQIILRTPALLALFTGELQPRKDETTGSFNLRRNVQQRGRSLLQQLSNPTINNVGEKGRLRLFIDAINEMPKENFDIDGGDDAWCLLHDLDTCLSNGSPIMIDLMVRHLGPTEKASLEMCVRNNKFPRVLCLNNKSNNGEEVTEFISVNGTTYQLQSVYNSTGKNSTGYGPASFGHATPSVRTSTGDFIVIDDITGVHSRTKQQVLDDLNQPRGWRSAYYVKVQDNPEFRG